MTTNIDQEVLQMKFDNSQFEKGVKETLNSVKGLKDKLNFKESAQSLNEVSNAAKNFSLEGMASSVETISSRFSTLGIIGTTALINIANTAVETGKRLVSALTIDPIKMGFEEYELKMGSIQTIMASTGADIATVNGYLDELNTYSDKTIYSFSDMTSNIGKFTNAGVKLEDAVMAIKGISNEAAVSGANANEASRAMYNFAQALSSGAVRLIDWKSIENANMATVEFKQQLMDTAVAMGTLVQVDGKYQSTTTDLNGNLSELFTTTSMFNDSLSSQWMTSEVLVETLKKYADETTDLGKKAFGAAQEIKTFSMLWDTLTEAAQSGWATTFQLIVGDFEEAKILLTEINDAVSPIIDGMSNMRNEPLMIWHDLGGRIALIDALRNVLSSIGNILGSIGKAFSEVFNDNVGQILYDLTIKFKNFTETLIVGDDTLSQIQYTFKGLFTVAKGVIGIFTKVAGVLLNVFSNAAVSGIKFLGTAFLTLGTNLSDCIFKIKDFIVEFMELESVKQLIEGVTSIIESLKRTFIAVTSSFGDFSLGFEDKAFTTFTKVLSKIVDGLSKVVKFVDKSVLSFEDWVSSSEVVESLNSTISSLVSFLDKVVSSARSVYNSISSDIGSAMKALRSNVKSTVEAVKDFIDAFMQTPEVQKFIEDVRKAVEELGKSIIENTKNGIETIGEFFEMIKDFDIEKSIDGFKSLRDNISEFGTVTVKKADNGITNFLDTIKVKFSEAVETGSDAVGFFTKKYATFQDFIGSFIEKIDLGTLAAAGISGSMTLLVLNLANTIKKVGDQLTNFLKVGNALQDFVKGLTGILTQMQNVLKAQALAIKMEAVGNIFLKFAGSVAILAISIGLLTMIDQEKLKSSAITLGIFAGALIALVGIIGILDKVFKAGNVEKYATVLIALSASLLIMTVALSKLDSVNTDGIWEKVTVLGALIGVLGAVVIAIQRFGSSSKAGEAGITMSALSIVAISVSLLVMVQAVKQLASIDASGLSNAVPVMGILASVLSAMTYLSSKISPGADISLLAVASAMAIMAFVIRQYSNISTDTLMNALPSLIVVMGLFSVLMIASERAGKYAIQGGVGLLAISAAMIVMAKAIEEMSNITPEMISSAMSSLTSILVLFALLTAVMSKVSNPATWQIGVALLSVSAGILIITGAIMLLAQLDEGDIEKATGAIVSIMAMFAILIASTKDAKDIQKNIIPMTAAIAVLATSVVALSLIDPNRLASATSAMTLLMMSLSAMVASTKFAKSAYGELAFMLIVVGTLASIIYAMNNIESPEAAIASAAAISLMLISISASLAIMNTIGNISKDALISIGILTGVVAALAVIIYAVSALSPENAISVALSLSVLLISMSAVCILLEGVKVAPAVEGAAGLIAVVSIIGTFIMAIGALVRYIPQLQEFLDTGIPVLQAIGEGIGAFVGGIIGGALDAATSSLPNVGENLSKFSTNIIPFVDSMSSIPSDFGSKVTSLATGLAILTGASFINTLSDFGNIGALFGGDSSLVKFGKQLEEFGACMVSFSNKCTEINADSVSEIVGVISGITDALSKLNPSGPLSFLFGSIDISEFGKSLEGLGNGVAKFATKVSGITASSESVASAIDIIKKLGEAQSYISPSGGLMQALCGANDFSSFANSLESLGIGVASFAANIASISSDSSESVNVAVDIVKKLGEAQDVINPSGGLMQALCGSTDFKTFGASLSELGKGISSFSASVEGMGGNSESIQAGIDAIKKLGEIQDSLSPSGGLIQALCGSTNFTNFGNSLKTLGEGIAGFASSLAGENVDLTKVDAAIESLRKLSEANETISGIDTYMLVSKAIGLKQLVDNMNIIGSLNPEVSNALNAVATLMSEIVSKIQSYSESIRTSSVNVGNQIGIGMSEGITTSSATIISGLNGCFSTIQSLISGSFSTMLSNTMKQLATNMGDGFKSSFDSQKRSINSSISMGLNSAASIIRSYYSSFYSAGSYLGSGLAAGLRASGGIVSAAARTVANNAYNSALKTLEVRSPSRKFMYIGKMSDMGLAKGLKKFSYYVDNSAVNVASSAYGTMYGLAQDIYDLMSLDLNEINPVIAPMLDMSNIQQGYRYINGILDSSRTVGLVSGIAYDNYNRLNRDSRVSQITENNYYLDGINVTNETDGNMVQDVFNLLVRYNRLAAI